MHYGISEITAAGMLQGNGTTLTVVTLEEEDTATALDGRTVYVGPGEVQYRRRGNAWDIDLIGGVIPRHL